MEQNRLFHGVCFKAVSPKYDCGLESPRETLAELVDMISQSETRAQEQGYPPQEWLVIRNVTNSIYKDDRFHYRSSIEEAIGIYGKDGKLRHLDGEEWNNAHCNA